MQTENETPQGESENLDAQGITESLATDSPSVEESEKLEEGQAPEAISKEEYDKLQKELKKLEMERNHLRNKQEEERRKQLEESNEFKTLYEETQAKLAEIEAEKEAEQTRKAAEDLRESFINDYPDEAVRKAAKALIERNPSNIAWGDVESEEQAKAQIFEQLDALKETLGVLNTEQSDEDYPEIHANNPATDQPNREIDKLKSMSADELRKILPIGDTR